MDKNSEEHWDESDSLGLPGNIHNELRGTVFGPSVQGRDIYGGIHIHEPATESPPPPRQLPPAGMLVGRQQGLRVLEEARTCQTGQNMGNVVVVSGPAGVGKTTLAVYWASAVVEEFADGQLYADLRGHAPHDTAISPAEVLAQFLRALGVVQRQIPAGLAERTALYRSLTSARRIIVVLDDAVSAAQVRPLLPASSHSVTVVTSRWRLASLLVYGARAIQLDRLEINAALELLGHAMGEDRVSAEPEAARELVRLCAQFPLALRVAAARLVVRPHLRIGELVEALSGERGRLAALSVGNDMAVRASLDLSYRALPASAARVYRLMGLYPGTVFEDRLAAATAALSVEDARYLLEVLTDANLLDDAPRAQYRFHDLIRLHAAEMAERDESPRLREQATRRMLDWLLFTVAAASRLAAPYLNDRPPDIEYEPGEPKRFKDSADALDWLEEEFPNLRAAARYAVDHAKDTFAWQLVDATWPLFLHRGHHQERLEFEQLGLGAARRSPDLYAQAKMLDRVGLALRDLGRFDEAADHVGEALEIWRKLPDRTRTASSLHRLGFMAADRHDLDAAIRHFTNALARYQELEDMRGMALTLNDLGSVLTESERSVEAIEHLERARQLLADHPDQYNQMRTIILLGCAHARSGDLHVATDLLDRAVAGMRDIGSRSGEAKALESLGDLAERSGKPDEARRYYLEALRILLPISRQKADRLRRCLARLDSPGKP